MIMKTAALLRVNSNPSRDEIVNSLSKNLCRCTGYTKILDAVQYAAELVESNDSASFPSVDVGTAVGGDVARLDSPETVTGEAIAADMQMDGMLRLLLRSKHHHARIISIDTSMGYGR